MNSINIISDLSFLIPEVFFILSCLVLLCFGTFYSNNYIFKYTNVLKPVTNLSIIFLIIYIFLMINNVDYRLLTFFYLFYQNETILFVKLFLITLTICLLFLSYKSLLLSKIYSFEFTILFLLSCLGSILLIISFDFIVIYLSIELQSLCFYILTSFQKLKNKSIEAGLKYFILGSFSSAFLLLGIAFIYGILGTTNFYKIALLLSLDFDYYLYEKNILYLGFILINIGIFFKLSVAPFHLWLPDVFDGISRFVLSIFSTIPKLSLVFLFYKIYNILIIKLLPEWCLFFMFFIFLSWIIGILGAIYTNKINKLFAYSSINHIGFFIFSIILNNPLMFLVYFCIYSFLLINLFSTFFILVKNNNNKELLYINQLLYLKKVNYVVALSLTISFFSIAGVPPLCGFFSKFLIFLAAVNNNYLVFSLIGLLLTVIGSFYYLRVVKIINFNNSRNWLFLVNVDKTTSYFLSFGIIFNVFFIFILPFVWEFLKYLLFISL